MQSVKTPLLVEETHTSLSSLTILGDETENGHDADDVPDNRRFIQQPILQSSQNATTSPNASTKTSTTTNGRKSLSKPGCLVGKSTSSSLTGTAATASTTTTTNDDDDDENDDDGDPLLRDSASQDLAMRKLPSTLFSPMSESCGSSLVEGSASGSALATPMEISRPASRGSGLGSSEFGTMKQSQSQHDWKQVERQLQKSHEREELRRFAKNDREQIRRKLAMEEDDVGDLFSEVLRFRHGGTTASGLRRSSSTSAAANSSLQICYINDDDVEEDDDDDGERLALTWDGSTYSERRQKSASKRAPASVTSPEKKPDVRKPATQLFAEASRLGIGEEEEEEEDEEQQSKNLLGGDRKKEAEAEEKRSVREFLSQQSKLQAEAKVALAQTLPMARMQMELERMSRKKSPIADIVGLQGGFLSDANKELTPRTLSNLNLAQLQVIFNDLHTQIENYNDLLLKYLEERDDLHMEQDAKLVDIEDLTRRLKQMASSNQDVPHPCSSSKNSTKKTKK